MKADIRDRGVLGEPKPRLEPQTFQVVGWRHFHLLFELP